MPNVSSLFHGNEIILYFGPKIWDIVPLELKELVLELVLLLSRKLLKSESQKTFHLSYVIYTYAS